jgi:type IV pilus modification protein PilV
MTKNRFNKSRGFSLLEVLVAVVILSVGLLALASLQLSMIRASAGTKTQSLATSLAKERLEAMRSFTNLTGYRNLTSAASPGTTEPTLTDVNGSQGGVDFTRRYLVERYVYNKAAATPGFVTVGNTLTDAALTALKDATHDYVLGKDFKRVLVTVSWTDATGVSQQVQMEDIIDGLDPAEAASLVKQSTSGGGPRRLEQRIVDPALDNMVIPIALGGGVDSAATNPKPTVVVGGNVVETRFDVLTYAFVTGGTATAQQKVETTQVGCTCAFDTTIPAATRGMRPTYWIGYRYATPIAVAASGTESYKPQAKADPASVGSQSAFCGICCRDHMDPSGVKGATFSPRYVTKNSSDVVTAKHEHYFDKAALSPATSGTYKEACRLIRVDGFWRVAADMEMDYYGLLATGDGVNADGYAPDITTNIGTPATPGGATARYEKFVLGYMDARVVSASPSAGNEQTAYNTIGDPDTLAASAPYVLNSPSSVTLTSPFTGTPSCTAITGITNANPAVVTHATAYTNCNNATPLTGGALTAGTFKNGDRVTLKSVAGMTQINNAGHTYTVANATATTFQLQGLDTSQITCTPVPPATTCTPPWSVYTSGGVAEVSHAKWVHSRGIYVDYLEKEAVDAITAAKADPSCSADMSLCVLKLIFFTTINTSEIADFDSADVSKATVTNNNYSGTLTTLTPVRGATAYIGGADLSTVAITGRSRRYNTSLLDLGFDSISPNDDFKLTDAQTFTISNPGATPTKPGGGVFFARLNIPLVSGLAVGYLTGNQASASCGNFPAAGVSGNLGAQCVVNNQESTTIAPVDSEDAGLGIAGVAGSGPPQNTTMGVEIVGYNSTGTATRDVDVPNCVGVGNAAGFSNKTFHSVTTGTPSGRSDPSDYTMNTCTVREVTAAQNLTTLANALGTAPYTQVGTGKNQVTQIKFPLINADPTPAASPYTDMISVTFGTATTTDAGVATCTFTCSALNGPGTNCADVSSTKFVITPAACP